MKKLILCIVALLLTHSDRCESSLKYYVCIILQDGSCYEEYFYPMYLPILVEDFCEDTIYESIFITRDLCATDQF